MIPPKPPNPNAACENKLPWECITVPDIHVPSPTLRQVSTDALALDPPVAISVPLETPTIQTIGCLLVDAKKVPLPSREGLGEGAKKVPLLPKSPQRLARGEEGLGEDQTTSKPSEPMALATGKPSVDPNSNHPKLARTAHKQPTPTSHTRIRPPRDVVKLEDRLHFLLQPPLENVFAGEQLDFPFRPFPYQFEGIAFLYPRHEAVLADEMGLGKTMQAVVGMRLLAHQQIVKRALLVCPKPLVTNWQREFAMWAPELLVTVFKGNQATRKFLWKSEAPGILLANYELLVRDREFLAEINEPFDLMVIDESQRIKNRLGTTNEVICSVPRRRSWALTGTPIENSIEDLVGIFQFVSPGCLHPGMKAPAIRRSVDDYVIRRTKDHVLTDLPPKLFRDAEIDLSPEQWQSYTRAEDEGVVHLSEMRAELTIQHVFELVLRLKQICNFDPATGASSKADRLEADLEECVASGRKAIVFSQWVKTIETLSSRLARFNPLEYHGKIPTNRRDPVIDTFREDADRHILLMSYGAGSVGLNLQFAGYVFLFDRWWNPAVEDQAINRAHRIGAAGPVTVTRMLALGTIEERINKVLEEKRELFDSVFDPTATPDKKLGLSRDEIFGLFDLKIPGAEAA